MFFFSKTPKFRKTFTELRYQKTSNISIYDIGFIHFFMELKKPLLSLDFVQVKDFISSGYTQKHAVYIMFIFYSVTFYAQIKYI